MNLNDLEILTMNLSLLNYDSLSKLNEKCFCKQNSSLMCQIIYFLLIKLEPTTLDTLRLCYPVVTLSDLKLFKDTVYPLLQSLLPNDVVPGRSVIEGGKGDKLIYFLRKFSDFVIKSSLSNPIQFDYVPELIGTGLKNDSENILQMKKKMILAHISNMKEVLLRKSTKINEIQEKWKKRANDLSENEDKLQKENLILQKKIKTILKNGSTRYSEIASIDRAPKIENHRLFLNLVDSIHKKYVIEDEFKNNIGYIDENNELYDSMTPQTLNKKESEHILILQEEAKNFDARVKKDNDYFKEKMNEKNKNNELNDLLLQMKLKIKTLNQNMEEIKAIIEKNKK